MEGQPRVRLSNGLEGALAGLTEEGDASVLVDGDDMPVTVASSPTITRSFVKSIRCQKCERSWDAGDVQPDSTGVWLCPVCGGRPVGKFRSRA